MTARPGRPSFPPAVDAALREFIHALGKAAMYPAGHRFVVTASTALTDRFKAAIGDRDSLTLGFTPRGLLLDGANLESLPAFIKEFASRVHRKNIGTIQILDGVSAEEVAGMLAAIARPDADETTGRQGFRRPHLRVEPLVYDVLAFADSASDADLDDAFWMQLIEAAFGRRLAEEEGQPTVPQIVEAISERAAHGEGARRVFEALTSFASAIAARGERAAGSARRRFVEVLSALSRPTTVRVVGAAPSAQSRRRFLRDTLQLVPPALLLQLLEVVAESDGEPISPHLRGMLGKLAGEGGTLSGPVGGGFAHQILGLIEQWDGGIAVEDELTDPRLGLEPARIVAAGLELQVASEQVVGAARRLSDRGQLAEVLQLLDHEQNNPAVVQVIADAVLEPGVLERLLSSTPIDFPLVERVARQVGAEVVTALLGALGGSEDRTSRRKLLDILVRIGPSAQVALLDHLEGAPWFLARNILVVLGNFDELEQPERVVAALRHEEPRVRQEALKVLLRQSASIRDRAIAEVLEGGEVALIRSALQSLGTSCPPRLIAPVVGVLGMDDDDLRLVALRVLSDVRNPLIVPHLLGLVRRTRGPFRRIRLEPATPLMLTAMEILGRNWPKHRPVLPVLQIAAKSPDPAVRQAMGGAA